LEAEKLKYFIDKKEVSESVFNERLLGQCLIYVMSNEENFLNSKEIKKVYNQLSPLEQTMADNMAARKELEKYKEEEEFKINLYRFRREK
jgi:hypothetical protein